MFDAADVDEALAQIKRAAQVVADLMEEHRRHVAEIASAGRHSLRDWLLHVATGIGGGLGLALGHVIGSLFRALER